MGGSEIHPGVKRLALRERIMAIAERLANSINASAYVVRATVEGLMRLAGNTDDVR